MINILRTIWRWNVLTAGLNSPPLILKKAHTFTAKLNPKASEIYSKFEELGN